MNFFGALLANVTTATSTIPGVMEIIESVLLMLAGTGVFLIGINAMGSNLETLAGSKIQTIFDKISGNRFTGLLTGAGVTAVIQSSGATTVMVVGFVNAGLMTLTQATPIIMGANIGTTITAQIVALESLKITAWFAVLAAVGAFMQMLGKKDSIKKIGALLAGLGMVFVGMNVMKESMSVFTKIPAITDALVKTTNPALLIIIAMALTALVQSSSATTGIMIALAGTFGIPIKSIMFATLGVNIGSCVTSIIASFGTNTNAKRASFIHLLFNVIGAIVFFPIIFWAPIDKLFEAMFPNLIETQCAMFHTFFNVAMTLLLIPFVKTLVWIATKVIPEKKSKDDIEENFMPERLKYIDKRILSTPAIAINQTKHEIILMSELAYKNFKLSLSCVKNGKVEKQEKFADREKHLNFLNREISKFLVELSAKEISFKDELMLASFYHVVSDLERVGDYSENIMEYAEELQRLKTTFSDMAIAQLDEMTEAIHKVFEFAVKAFEYQDMELLETVYKYEDMVDDFKSILDRDHIKRLNNNQCSASTGAVYLSLVSNLERISDHMQNIAKSITDYTAKPKKVYAIIK